MFLRDYSGYLYGSGTSLVQGDLGEVRIGEGLSGKFGSSDRSRGINLEISWEVRTAGSAG